jgi:hypothetical protein
MSEKIIIAAKIDVTKIDKSRLFQGKNGAKYLDVILLETEGSQYGDHFMVKESVTKEEREANPKAGTILGNAKFLRGNPRGGSSRQRPNTYPTGTKPDTTGDAPPPNDGDDVPF